MERPVVPDRIRAAIAPLLLVAVALHQISLHARWEISPWKGGGFGMFSSSDGLWSRHSHLFVSSDAGETEVDLPDDLEEAEERLRTLPSEGRMTAFATRLSEALAPQRPDHTGVRIELWRTRFDADDLTQTTARFREHLHHRDGDDGP